MLNLVETSRENHANDADGVGPYLSRCGGRKFWREWQRERRRHRSHGDSSRRQRHPYTYESARG